MLSPGIPLGHRPPHVVVKKGHYQSSAEEEEQFQTWYEEGYDLFDPTCRS